MKKLIRTFVLFAAIGAAASGYSQTLGQDAEGSSTVVTPATSLNLDITNNVGSFVLNREFGITDTPLPAKGIEKCCSGRDANGVKAFLEAVYNKNSYLYGMEVKGELKDGIGTLFSDEKVASSVSVGGLIGLKKTWTGYSSTAVADICNAYNKDNAILSAIRQAELSITPDLLRHVSLQTGIPASVFIPAGSSDDEMVAFYKSNLDILTNFRTHKFVTGTKVQEKQQRLAKLMALEPLLTAAVPEVAKYTGKDAALELSIYRDHYVPLQLQLATLLPEVSFQKPFDKSAYTDALSSVQKEIISLAAETGYLSAVSAGADTPEIIALKAAYTTLLGLYKSRIDNGKDLPKKAISENVWPNSRLVYLRANFRGWDYKYDLDNDSTLVKERFVDRRFNGYTIEAGVTYNFRRCHYLGLSAGFTYASNISGLTATTYKLEKTDPEILEGKFSSASEIKALSGAFDAFTRYDLNFDYIYLLPVLENPGTDDDKRSPLYISINPYLRHRIYENSTTLKNNTVAGLGIHAYSSKDNKIMGGLFVQTADLFGVHADDDSTLGKRIVFGLIAKYNITGLKLEPK